MAPFARILTVGLAALSLVVAAPAHAFNSVVAPGPDYVGETSMVGIEQPDNSALISISDPNLSISFGHQMQVASVPATWLYWGRDTAVERNETKLVWNRGAETETITLSKPVSVFGVEAGPFNIGTYAITARFYSGALCIGTVRRITDVFGNALLFAGRLPMQPIDRVTFESQGTSGIAFAHFRHAAMAAIPEPGSFVLLLCGLPAALAFRRKK